MSLYLYWRDDQDLLLLKSACGKNFLAIVRECLSAYLTGEKYALPYFPNGKPSYDNETTTLSFPDKQCPDIVEFLSKQPKGQQSNSIKFVLRHYMNGFRDDGYFSGPLQKKCIKLRLSTGHDSDLLGLYYHDQEAFEKWVCDAARAHVRGENYIFHVPEGLCAARSDDAKTSTVLIHLSEQDKDVIEYLDELQDGLRESALKNILRTSFDRPILCQAEERKSASLTERANNKHYDPAGESIVDAERKNSISSNTTPYRNHQTEKQREAAQRAKKALYEQAEPYKREEQVGESIQKPRHESMQEQDDAEEWDMDIFASMER